MTPGSSRPTLVLVVAALLWIGAFLYARSPTTDMPLLTGTLSWLGPWMCAIAFLAAGLLILTDGSGWRWMVRLLSGRQWALVVTMLAAVLTARLALVPAQARLYYDEHTYAEIARGIADQGRVQVATLGRIDDRGYTCEVCSYPHWPAAWPTLVAAALSIDAQPLETARNLNLLLSLVGMIAVALLGAALYTGSHGVLAAIVYAGLPANAAWSRTGTAETLAACTAALAVLLALRYAGAPYPRNAWALAALLAVAVQVRNESLMLVAVCLMVIFARDGSQGLGAARWPAAVAAIILLPQAMHLGVLTHGYDPDLPGEVGFGLTHLTTNLGALARYLAGEPVTTAALGLAFYGLVIATPRRVALPLVAWLALGMGPALFYFAGRVTLPGGERMLLAWLAPLSLGAAAGLVDLGRRVPALHPFVFGTLSATLFGIVLVWGAQHTASQDLETAIPRADTAFLREALADLPPDALVITAVPALVLAEGRSAAFTPWAGCAPDALEGLAADAGGGLFYFIAPSVSPDRWADGRDCEAALLAATEVETVRQVRTAAGRQGLYRLEVLEEE